MGFVNVEKHKLGRKLINLVSVGYNGKHARINLGSCGDELEARCVKIAADCDTRTLRITPVDDTGDRTSWAVVNNVVHIKNPEQRFGFKPKSHVVVKPKMEGGALYIQL